MSRAGVPTDIAERCLAHAIGGVRGVYDRHAYSAEKRDAFQRLGTMIESVVGSGRPTRVTWTAITDSETAAATESKESQ